MDSSLPASLLALAVSAVCWVGPVAAQQPADETSSDIASADSESEDGQTSPSDTAPSADPSSDDGDGTSRPDDADDGSKSADEVAEPAALSPEQRLERAEQAFHSGNFDTIPPLLGPILGSDPSLSGDALIRARELLGVGLYFKAEEASSSDKREKVLDGAREQFLALLRQRPDYELDSLLFPARAVELFESVRQQHSDELESIRGQRQPSRSQSGETETVYIERQVQQRIYGLNFFPFAIGQFQNGQPIKGSLLGLGQLAGLAVHTIGFIRIESIRRPNGFFCNPRIGDCEGGSYNTARRWRTAQVVAGSAAVGLFVISVADALLQYEGNDVNIRMRDEPPPELSSTDAGNGPSLEIGFGSVNIRW